MRMFEDIRVGDAAVLGTTRVERDEVIAFATRYDPQPFHLDDAAAAATHFGRIAASGWHTCAMVMRVIVDAAGTGGVASLGSPGIDELRWLKPVYPGDDLTVASEVVQVRASRSNPAIGSVWSRVSVTNQRQETVMTMVSIALLRRRRVPGA